MITETMVGDALYRSGVIAQRAVRESRSLNKVERNILRSAYKLAEQKNLSKNDRNRPFLAGMLDREAVVEPIKVHIVFGYFEHYGADDIEAPRAMYFVRESNHPGLSPQSHVSVEDILAADQKIPKTPTYEKWVAAGSKVVRS